MIGRSYIIYTNYRQTHKKRFVKYMQELEKKEHE